MKRPGMTRGGGAIFRGGGGGPGSGGGPRPPWIDRGGPGPRPMTMTGFPRSRGGPFRGASVFRGRGRGGSGW